MAKMSSDESQYSDEYVEESDIVSESESDDFNSDSDNESVINNKSKKRKEPAKPAPKETKKAATANSKTSKNSTTTTTTSKSTSNTKTTSANNDNNENAASTTTSVNRSLPSNITASIASSLPRGKNGKAIEVSGKDAENLLAAYMLEQNRPYAPLQIFENLHEAIKKGQISKYLDNLVEQGILYGKLFNKTTIYHYNQDKLPKADPEVIKNLDNGIAKLQKEYTEINLKKTKLLNEINSLESSPATVDAEVTLNKLEESLNKKKKKLEDISELNKNMKVEDLNKIKKNYYNYLKEWKKRKKGCIEMMGMYLENVSKTQKAFMTELGLETDEEYKADITKCIALSDRAGCDKVK